MTEPRGTGQEPEVDAELELTTAEHASPELSLRGARRRVARFLGRRRLSTHLAAIGATLVAVVVVGSFAALSVRLRATAREGFAEELSRTQQTLLRLERRELAQLLWTAALVGETPTLRAAIETWRVEGEHAGAKRDELLATMRRSTDQQLDGLSADLLVVVDARGKVLAASARDAAAPRVGDALGTVPAVRTALDPEAPVDSTNVGVVRLREDYYSAAAAPIVLGGYTIGAVLVGERIDQQWVRALHEAFEGEIVVRGSGRAIGSTLPAGAVELMPPDVGHDTVRTLRIDGEDYVAGAFRMGVTQRGEPVTLYLLHPVGSAVRELTSAFARDFILFGLAALVVTIAVGTFGARFLLAPLQRIVALMRRSARTGEFRRAEAPAAAPREIRWLAESYSQLIAALEVERESVSRRTTELEAANADLTQQIRERVRVEQVLHDREEQLRQAQKLEALGTLAGGVAHDFNNLLTVISGFTQLALSATPREQPVHEDLLQVKDAAHRAAELTAQLLAFGRRQVLRPQVLDLNVVVTRIETMLRRLIGAQLRLEVALDRGLARVHADPGQLEQVLMNLAINARDAMPEGGTLTIRTRNVTIVGDDLVERDAVELSVKDTGIGMDASTRERIFEPFFTTKEMGKGTGLGLATVYGIVQQSGGSIMVESSPGVGSLFRIVLPAVQGNDGAITIGDERHELPRGSEVVLLVEDELQLLSFAQRVLRAHGYVVIPAANGIDALLAADRHAGPIHLLVTDIVMPRMTGHELARRLHLARPETRVLLMSGHSEDAVAVHGNLGAGAAFMRKPFAPDQLVEMVRTVLDAEQVHA